MSGIDWIICIVPILVVLGMSIYAQRFVKNTADFLVASRTGGRYLLTSTSGLTGIGVITFVASLEVFHQVGWSLAWWNNIGLMVGLILALTGFVFYRYRQTRVLTMAQFFEVRYSRCFRIWMGLICFISGVLNFGIFPAVTAQFFMIFLQLPQNLFGLPVYPFLMVLLLGTAATITIAGGQVQNMVTDTIQALFSYGFSVIIGISILYMFSNDEIRTCMTSTLNSYSYVNPFDSIKMQDFNLYFIAISIFTTVCTTGVWQGSQGYAGAAMTPHESKMGGILNTWRMLSLSSFSTLVALGALTYLYYNPDIIFVNSVGVASNAPKDSMIGAISLFLPIGLKGMFVALMFFFMLSTDTTYLHSWGVIFVQDVIMPIYGKPLEAKTHLLLLRLSIGLVAVCGFLFSMFYVQNDFVQMFLMATGAFFTAAGGCAIIGGLYWKKGTKEGAWTALFVGVLSSSFNLILLNQSGWQLMRGVLLHFFPNWEFIVNAADKCPINGAWLGFISMVLAIVGYLVVSLVTCKQNFNMEHLLHRGIYTIKDDKADSSSKCEVKISWFKRFFLGFDSEFSRSDKIISISAFCWVMFWFWSFVGITIWNLIGLVTPDNWIKVWGVNEWFDWMMFTVKANLWAGAISAVGLTIGGYYDILRMFKILKNKRHSVDDGFVSQERGRM